MEEKPFASSSSQPSSSFKPKLNDQDYMELVCENGQILAKGRRSKSNGSFQNQRTQSHLLDLYESEYYDGIKKTYIKNFGDTQVVPVSESQPQQDKENDEQMNNNKKKKITSSKIKFERNVSKSHKRVESSTLINDSAKSSKNVEVTKAPPDEQSAAVGRSTELYFASSSIFSRGTSRDQSFCSFKRKHGDMEEEESTYLSNNSDDESDNEKTQVHVRTRKPVTKRKRSTEVHKLSERKQRDEFNKKLRDLQDLLPNCYKDDKASLLDEAIKYMRTLQLQVQMMSMRNGLIRPPTMLPMGHYSPMGLGMHMDAAATATSVPQFMPMIVQGTGFQGISNASSQMLSFLNHHSTGLMPNSPIFSPLENCSHQQFIVPSCAPQTQATSFTQLPKSASTSSLEDAMQFRGSNGYYRSLN